MALNWNWDEKIGEIIFEQERDSKTYEYTLSLYEGNAFLIMLREYKSEEGKDMYDMYSFFVDKPHAKRCLGLQKNCDGELVNCFDDSICKFKSVRLNKAKSKHWKDIMTMFGQAFDTINIEIYNEK